MSEEIGAKQNALWGFDRLDMSQLFRIMCTLRHLSCSTVEHIYISFYRWKCGEQPWELVRIEFKWWLIHTPANVRMYVCVCVCANVCADTCMFQRISNMAGHCTQTHAFCNVRECKNRIWIDISQHHSSWHFVTLNTNEYTLLNFNFFEICWTMHKIVCFVENPRYICNLYLYCTYDLIFSYIPKYLFAC